MIMEAKKNVNLPQELITEILLRLPVKILSRFKCVSKSWNSLISHDSHFATSHFQLSASPKNKIFFISYDALVALSVDFESSLNNYVSLNLDILNPLSYIGGSCRGFLFIYNQVGLYLLNPSTRVHKQIPVSPLTIASYSQEYFYSYFQDYIFRFWYGFGYDSSTDDYLVVLGFGNAYSTKLLYLEIFSLRANNWKQIVVGSHLPYKLTDQHQSKVGLFFNGSIHWLVYNYETRRDVIIVFHLKEMRMCEIAFPDDFYIDSSVRNYGLFVFDSLIGVWNADLRTFKIRVMQEYAVYSSWTETVSISAFQFSAHAAPAFSPVCFTNCGDLVGRSGDGGLAKFNDKGELLEDRSYPDCFFERSQMTVYTESLLSLPDSSDQV